MKKIAMFLATILILSCTLMVFSACAKNDSGNHGNGSTPGSGDLIERPDKDSDGPYGEGRILNIYLWSDDGTTSKDMDAVVAEWKSRVKDRFAFDIKFTFDTQANYKQKLPLEMSGASDAYDLIFDAPWMFLTEWAQNGYYKDLTGYFQNPNFPGLEKAFDDNYLRNNMFKGKDGKMGVYSIPLTENFGGGGTVVYYREDWRKQAVASGVTALKDGINTLEELEAYFAWVKSNKTGIRAPFGQNKDGNYGAFNVIQQDQGVVPVVQYNEKGIKQGIAISSNLQASAYINPENNTVVEAALQFEKPGSEQSYPAPFNKVDSSWEDPMRKAREWYTKGWSYSDVQNESDAPSQFLAGNYGAFCGDIANFSTYQTNLKQNNPSAELEVFITEKNMREQIPGVLGSNFQAWNFIGIPSFSKDWDLAILFMDWLFESRENHDLFQYGIEGVNWKKIDDPEAGSYRIQTDGYTKYNFPAYVLTWNPTYLRMPADWTEKATAFKLYIDNPTTYVEYLYPEFRFDGTASKVAQALLNPDLATYATDNRNFYIGVIDNPIVQYNQVMQKWYNNKNLQDDLATIEDALIEQLQAYVDAEND